MTFVRYIGIQLLAYGIDMGMFLVLLLAGSAGPVLANVVAKLAAGSFAFVAHRRFTFRVVDGIPIKGQALRYFILLALNIPVASAILALMLLLVDEPVAAKLISDVIIVGLTYLISRHFIFSDRQGHSKKTGSAGAGV